MYYDGRPLTELNLPDLRRQFGVVLQESVLLGSILSNITRNGPMMDLDRVIGAAEIAAIHEEIMASLHLDVESGR